MQCYERMTHELYYETDGEIITGSCIEKNVSVEFEVQPKVINKKCTDVVEVYLIYNVENK